QVAAHDRLALEPETVGQGFHRYRVQALAFGPRAVPHRLVDREWNFANRVLHAPRVGYACIPCKRPQPRQEVAPAGLTFPQRGQRQVLVGIADRGASPSRAPQTWQTRNSASVLVQTGRTEKSFSVLLIRTSSHGCLWPQRGQSKKPAGRRSSFTSLPNQKMKNTGGLTHS